MTHAPSGKMTTEFMEDCEPDLRATQQEQVMHRASNQTLTSHCHAATHTLPISPQFTVAVFDLGFSNPLGLLECAPSSLLIGSLGMAALSIGVMSQYFRLPTESLLTRLLPSGPNAMEVIGDLCPFRRSITVPVSGIEY